MAQPACQTIKNMTSGQYAEKCPSSDSHCPQFLSYTSVARSYRQSTEKRSVRFVATALQEMYPAKITVQMGIIAACSQRLLAQFEGFG
jgi:hypothetical protein